MRTATAGCHAAVGDAERRVEQRRDDAEDCRADEQVTVGVAADAVWVVPE